MSGDPKQKAQLKRLSKACMKMAFSQAEAIVNAGPNEPNRLLAVTNLAGPMAAALFAEARRNGGAEEAILLELGND